MKKSEKKAKKKRSVSPTIDLSVRPEFEGPDGRALLRLQMKSAGDDRFRITEAFRTDQRRRRSGSDDDDSATDRGRDGDDNEGGEEDAAAAADRFVADPEAADRDDKASRQAAMSALASLYPTAVSAAADPSRGVAWAGVTRYDPTAEAAQNDIILTAEEKARAKAKAAAETAKQIAKPAPIVSKELFVRADPNLGSMVREMMYDPTASQFQLFGQAHDDPHPHPHPHPHPRDGDEDGGENEDGEHDAPAHAHDEIDFTDLAAKKKEAKRAPKVAAAEARNKLRDAPVYAVKERMFDIGDALREGRTVAFRSVGGLTDEQRKEWTKDYKAKARRGRKKPIFERPTR
eukprot:TRINITY_DN116_c1_g1_i3.p1 TRINITY_DN116_c1_g1~~TRINITY_DN116_c1_g1_i3.p1  ORF type:complete len:346 (+),score=192.07 TRINITY_DN116_c1_g1_i3:185-1222(+)